MREQKIVCEFNFEDNESPLHFPELPSSFPNRTIVEHFPDLSVLCRDFHLNLFALWQTGQIIVELAHVLGALIGINWAFLPMCVILLKSTTSEEVIQGFRGCI